MTVSSSPRRAAGNPMAVAVFALLIALGALFFALCTDPFKSGFAFKVPFSSGLSGYDFESPAGAYKSQMQAEVNMDVRAQLEYQRRMRDKDMKEKLDTLKVTKESDYKTKKKDEEIECKVLFVEYKVKGKDKKEVVVMEKDKESGLWRRGFISDLEVENTNKALAEEMKKWATKDGGL